MLNNESDDSDLVELALQVVRRALDPEESDPSRVSIVAALYILDRTERADPVGGIELDDSHERDLDSLLSHLDGDGAE